jgi:hypothetical protein
MGRKREESKMTMAVRAYLAAGEDQLPEQYRLDVKHVATAIGVSRTSLYKYGLVAEIQAAAQRQRERLGLAGAPTRRPRWRDLVRRLRAELQQANLRNQALVAQLNLVEANAARLGLDPEALFQPLVKPARTLPRNGRTG